jgi:hypothetical protein
MTPEHYDAYAAARSALISLGRTGSDEVFGACHEMLLELDDLHPETAVAEALLRSHATRTTAWNEAKKAIEVLVDHGVDGLRLALLLESLERAWYIERNHVGMSGRSER